MERTSYRIFRKMIELKMEKRVAGLWEGGDWTFWKVRPPPKRKKELLTV
jgi:hypothetical protein